MRDADAPWQLQPVDARARLVLALLCIGVPMLATVVVSRSLPESALVFALVLAAWCVLDRLMRRHRVAVDGSGLEVATAMYRRRLAWSELKLDAARVISIDEHPERKPRFKTNGMAAFGFRAGWFRSRDLARLFVATTGGERLLWLPTTLGYTLLLEPRRPQALLERLRELAPPPPRR